MGAEQSLTQQGQLSITQDANWVSMGHKDDKIFGDIKLYHQKLNKSNQLAVVHRVCQSDTEHIKILTKYQKSQQYNDIPGMIKTYEIANQNEDAFCSKMFKVSVAFEYYSYNLQSDLESRTQNQLYHHLQYNQSRPYEDICGFLQHMLSTLNSLEQRGYLHGDLRPQNILISSEGHYKITNTHNMDQYKKFIVGLEENCYLAPELFHQLSTRAMRPQYDKQRSDVFTLGLVTLCMGTLSSSQFVYNYETFQINKTALTAILSAFETQHGSTLTQFVRQMVELDPQLRPTFQQLIQVPVSVKGETSPHRYSPATTSPAQYQYSQSQKKDNSGFLLKIESVEEKQQIKLDETGRKNWASEFLNDADTVIHVPCNPGDDYLKMPGEFLPKQIYKLDDKTNKASFASLNHSKTPSKMGGSTLKRPKLSAFQQRKEKENNASKRWVK